MLFAPAQGRSWDTFSTTSRFQLLHVWLTAPQSLSGKWTRTFTMMGWGSRAHWESERQRRACAAKVRTSLSHGPSIATPRRGGG